jgi:hypothetical protein
MTDKIASNNLNWIGFNSFYYCVQHLAYCLFMDTLKLTTHPAIYGVKAEFPKIAWMSISELLPNRSAAAMIPDDNNPREIIRYVIDVQKRAKCLGVILSYAQIPKLIFFLRAHCNGKRGLFLFTYRKYCYYFPSSFYSKV